MIPYHDENETRRPAYVTMLIIALCVFAWLFVQGAGAAYPLAESVCNLGLIPGELTGLVPPGVGFAMGDGLVCVTDPGRQYLNVFTSMFLHGGWLHLLGNMLFLCIFGNNVEDRLGRIRFLLFYLVCGYASAYGFALANVAQTRPLVGASGAVSGVLGAYFVLFPRAKVWSLVPVLFFLPLRLPAWLVLGLWFVIQWVYSAGYAVSDAGSVAYLAHVVGFVLGMALAMPARGRRDPEPQPLHRPHPGW